MMLAFMMVNRAIGVALAFSMALCGSALVASFWMWLLQWAWS